MRPDIQCPYNLLENLPGFSLANLPFINSGGQVTCKINPGPFFMFPLAVSARFDLERGDIPRKARRTGLQS